MTIGTVCANCGKRYEVDEKFAGRRLGCKKCGGLIVVQALAAGAVAAHPSAQTRLSSPVENCSAAEGTWVRLSGDVAARSTAVGQPSKLPWSPEGAGRIDNRVLVNQVPRLAPLAAVLTSVALCHFVLGATRAAERLSGYLHMDVSLFAEGVWHAVVATLAAGACVLVFLLSERITRGSLPAAIAGMSTSGLFAMLLFAGTILALGKLDGDAVLDLLLMFLALVIYAAPIIVTLAMLWQRARGAMAPERARRGFELANKAFLVAVVVGTAALTVMNYLVDCSLRHFWQPNLLMDFMLGLYRLFFDGFRAGTVVGIAMAATGLIWIERRLRGKGTEQISIVGLVYRAVVVWLAVALLTFVPVVGIILSSWVEGP